MTRLSGYTALALACALVMSTFARGADKALSSEEFVTRAATLCTAEIKMSKMADKHASDEKVKEFALRLTNDHAKMCEQLEEVAGKMKVIVLPEFTKDIRGTLEGLAARTGAQFDTAYMTRIVQDHEKAVKLFEIQAENTTNEDLKKFCNDALPRLQEHLKQARKVADGLK